MSTSTATQEPTALTTTVRDVTCIHCGCLCDDLVVQMEAGVATQVTNGCDIARSRLLEQREAPAEVARVRGRPASLEEAVDGAARILLAADLPWVDGIANTTIEAQRVLLDLAALSRGILSGPPGASSLEGALTTGMVTATLGEVKNRADVIVLWNCDPSLTHPRHFERYSIDAVGRWTPKGRADRTVIALGGNAPLDQADESIVFADGMDFEAAWTLRALLHGLALDPARVEQATGSPLDRWIKSTQTLKEARYAAILHDPSIHPQDHVEHVTRAILDLVADLNGATACAYIPLVGAGNPTGAEQVTAWSTGVLGAVDFSSGQPMRWRGERTTSEILRNRTVDAALLVGRDPMADCRPEDWQWLGHIPTIVLSAFPTATSASAAVSFLTAEIGRSVSGTVFRSDGACLPLRPLESSRLPSDLELLVAIRRRMTELAR